MDTFRKYFKFVVVALIIFFCYQTVARFVRENAILRQMIARLEADSRAAQILVTSVNFDETSQKTFTTIKFLEFDAKGTPMEPRYFTFSGNIIQFQALVIRFDDLKVKLADRLRGKSAYLFMNAFMLDRERTQVFEITKVNDVPQGYRVDDKGSEFEKKLWREFWHFALDRAAAKKMGIKNAQIEAPGTVFIPGTLYTIKIEHDGGLRIDAQPLPEILKGETIK